MSGGEHQAVMLAQAVEGLNVGGERGARAEGIYVDGTFGRGGHSREILALLGSKGRLIALDRDPDAIKAGAEINDQRFTLLHGWFGEMRALLADAGVEKVDGILLDLGVSSPQLDDAARGFSFRFDAPLDMRMDTSRGITVAQWLATAEESEIREVIKNHGEERFAKQIAAAIVTARAGGALRTTRQLATLVADAVPSREPRQDPATRTFQALRIHLNRELEELSLVLPQCVELLNPGGRLAVISFHSLEDRIVKRFMREAAAGERVPQRLPLRAHEMPQPLMRLIGKARRPDEEEVARNPRARSATLRVAERK
ncbi:MAG: 16S rRNA (cytosine(1402)-N(4))-methyltransferase RsmH [Burkholderiales bacterium]